MSMYDTGPTDPNVPAEVTVPTQNPFTSITNIVGVLGLILPEIVQALQSDTALNDAYPALMAWIYRVVILVMIVLRNFRTTGPTTLNPSIKNLRRRR